MIALTGLPADLADPRFRLPSLPVRTDRASCGAECLVEHRGAVFHVHIEETDVEPAAVLLPLDQLFEIRATAAIRFWRGATGRAPAPNPSPLSRARRDRLILALRAVDGRIVDASYREIARVLFGGAVVSEPGWKTHHLRDRTIRLVRSGHRMVHGGYRGLLLYPYRHRRPGFPPDPKPAA